ncbi:hypothetical protein [Oceanimonas smirnovii]|uniref:hypothetical protein n=1 Tax=Oceanimonas smirnovii TaxID=264574 RepID=UPI00376F8A11
MEKFEYLPDTNSYRCLQCGSRYTTFTATENKEERSVPEYDQDGDEQWVEREMTTETVVVATCRHCKNQETEAL